MFNAELFLVFIKEKGGINGFKNFKNEMFFLVFCERFVTFCFCVLA